MKNHKDLEVWNQSIDLVTTLYKSTKGFPKDEKFGLTTQVRRSAISIPSNIAEGASRQGNKEYVHFLYVAIGSANELDTQLIIANRLGFIQSVDYELDSIRIIRMKLYKLIAYLKNK